MPVQKTEPIHPQQNPALPDFVGQKTARAKIDYRMPGVDDDSGGKNVVVVWATGDIVAAKCKRQTQTNNLQLKNNNGKPTHKKADLQTIQADTKLKFAKELFSRSLIISTL
jgi:hypothetical protein